MGQGCTFAMALYLMCTGCNELYPYSRSVLGTLLCFLNNKKILCLYATDLCDNPDQAKNFLQPANKLVGDKIYYYALVKDLKPYNINPQKISGFKQFTDKITATF